MPSEVAYLPLKGASRDARTTKANMQWPALSALDNFNCSTSTETPMLRAGISGKAVLPHLTLASGTKNWLNTIVPQSNLYTESFLTRIHPAAYAATVGDALRCTAYTYTVTISAASTTVTRIAGNPFLGKVFPGDLFKFSGDDTYYEIASITNNDVLELVAEPGAKTTEECSVYITHCPYRGQWPLVYGRFGNIHIYHATDPTGASPQAYLRPPFLKAANNDVDIITTTSGTPDSYNYYPIQNVVPVSAPRLLAMDYGGAAGVVYALERYYEPTNVTGQLVFYVVKSSNDGVTWGRIGSEWFAGFTDRSSPSLSYDSVNARALYTYNYSRRYAIGGASSGIVGHALAKATTTTGDSYEVVLWTPNSGVGSAPAPTVRGVLYDGTYYCAAGSRLIDYVNRKACAWRVAISGLTKTADIHMPLTAPFNSATEAVMPSGSNLNAMLFDSAIYVAVGDSGSVMTSSDFATWTERNGGNQTYKLLAVANNSTTDYVAVGTNGTIIESADASTWNSATSGVTTDLNAVCYGNSLFVAVGAGGVILTSPDRTTWTARTSGTSYSLSSVKWDGTYFVVGSDIGNVVLISTDGITWADTAVTAPGPVTEVAQGALAGRDECIVATRDGGAIAYPEGERNWIPTPWPSVDTQDDCNGIAYANSLYVAVGNAGKIATSTDGVTWTARTSGVASDLLGVCYDTTNAKWIAVGSALLTSADAITWSDDSASIPATLTATTFRRVRYIPTTAQVVAVGHDATANRSVTMYSGNATNWTHALMANQDSDEFWDVTYNVATSEYLWCGIGTNGGAGAVWRNATLEYTNADIASNANFHVTDITGMTFANSTWGRLYARWTDSTTTLDWYSDSARTTLVASGVGAPGTTITMAEQGGSGLSGSVDVSADQSGDLDFTVHVECTAESLATGTSSTCIRSVWYDTNRIVWAGIGSAACGYMGTNYSAKKLLNINANCYSISMARTPESATAGTLTNAYWIGYDNGLILVNIGNQTTTTESVYWYPLLNSGCNCFMILDGYVVVLGTRELSGGTWTYYPRRARWTVPGTYSDFSGFGSGTQDFPGWGDFLAAEVVEHTGVIFEKGGIGALNWTGETDPTAGPIWTYRQIARGLTTISNPVVHEGAVWFVGNTGLMYRTNGIEAVPTGGDFDLSKFTEFPPTTPVQMVFVPATRQLAVLVQSSGEVASPITYVNNQIYFINIDTGKTSTWSVSSPGQRLSLVQVVGADTPTWPA